MADTTANTRNTAKLLRVAAYCRAASAADEDDFALEAQRRYCEEKIAANPDWEMVGFFADAGISDQQAKNRPEFMRMLRQCKQKEIDIVLVKSLSRFARNTPDCLYCIRMLKELGVAVIFAEHDINTLDKNSEMMISILCVLAQMESENIWQGKYCYPMFYAKNRGVITEGVDSK